MAKTLKPLSPKKIDALIESIYYRECSGIQINIMDISKVFKAGQTAYQEAFAAGAGTETVYFVTRAVKATVETLRQN